MSNANRAMPMVRYETMRPSLYHPEDGATILKYAMPGCVDECQYVHAPDKGPCSCTHERAEKPNTLDGVVASGYAPFWCPLRLA